MLFPVEGERDRETERERDRQTDRQTDRQRQRDRETETKTEREIEREIIVCVHQTLTKRSWLLSLPVCLSVSLLSD